AVSTVTISDVRVVPVDGQLILASSLDHPKQDAERRTFDVLVSGWVVGAQAPCVAIEVESQGQVLKLIPVSYARPDVGAEFAEIPYAARCGFRGRVSAVRLQPSFSVQLRVLFSDGTRELFAAFRGTREPLGVGPRRGRQPLMVTSLGRTGTTWLLHLLAQHPSVVIHPQYPYEFRIARYWLHVLGALTEPPEHTIFTRDSYQGDLSLVGANPYYEPGEEGYLEWLGSEYVSSVARFCRSSIDSFYARLAEETDKADAAFFAEKFVPDSSPWLMLDLYPKAREIFLVRDFRDMFCSIRAFNEKRGYHAFGREEVASDREHLQQLRRSALRLLEDSRKRAKQSLLVRYEDLVTRPEETLARVTAYLGLDSSDDAVRALVQAASDEDEELEELEEHRTTGSAAESIGRWRRDLPDDLREACAEAFGDLLEAFGYEVGDIPAGEPRSAGR
ncbi:MAG: sulfotransferase family protein, partial [Gaiellaceae bacterium]